MSLENKVIEKMKVSLNGKILEASNPRARRIFVKVKPEAFKDAVKLLVEDLNVKHLSTITGMDLGEKIELIYHFAFQGAISISLKVDVPKESPRIPSIVNLVPGAILYEREVHDVLGVNFEGHPDLSRLILPEDWPEGVYPLRKEYSPEDLRKLLSKNGGKS